MKKFTLFLAALLISMTAFADYFVAGSSSLCGSNWSNNDPNNKMTLINGVYVKTFPDVPAGSHEFKITNGTWDNAKGVWCVDAATSTPGYTGTDNVSFVLKSATTIVISYNESTDKITLKAEGLNKFGEFTITSYTVCGDFPFLAWEPANTANHMTQGADGIWTKTYKNVVLEAKTYQYKVAANNNWGNGEFPTSGANQNYEVKAAGTYDVTFAYNPAKPELTCTAVAAGAGEGGNEGGNEGGDEGGDDNTDKVLYPVDTLIYVTVHAQWLADNARFAAYFFGSNGDIWANMTIVEDGIYSVKVPQGEWYGMIICRMNPNVTDNTWDNLWGAQTIDIMYEPTKNHYVINSEEPTWDGSKPSGYWSNYEAPETTTAIDNVSVNNIYGRAGRIFADTEVAIYTVTGQNVTRLNGNLVNGVYIVKSANTITKVILK